jgi:hypothetical protein
MRFKLIVGNTNQISFKTLNPKPLEVCTQLYHYEVNPTQALWPEKPANQANIKLKRSFTMETPQKTTSQGCL